MTEFHDIEESSIEQFQKEYPYLQNRELSWLEFNKRVLDQGADPTVPLLERLGFISIFWSNLQEFFMVRVGSLTDLSLLKQTIIDPKSGMMPTQQLDAVYARCHELYPYYEQCFENLRELLAGEGIRNLMFKDLDEEQRAFIADYFDLNIFPFLSPQIVNTRHPFPHLENGALYIVVRLDEEAYKADAQAKRKAKADKTKSEKAAKGEKRAKNQGAEGVTLGIIPLPRQCDRLVQLPGSGMRFMLLEHVIEAFVPRVFSMYKVKHTNVICVTRNADLDATEGAEEQGADYVEHMKKILKKRSRLAPVRLESERELSNTVKGVLLEKLGLENHQTFVTKVPLDMSYVYAIAPRLKADKRSRLTFAPFTPQWPATLDRTRPLMPQLLRHDTMLLYPYETFDVFVQLLREAAYDPDVVSIKITLYRLAKQSHLAEALIAAAENGKEVTVVDELRARFDESNNIEWSQRFDQAGCRVIYGFKHYKVHSKICCITRRTDEGPQFITQLGTGNYNEKTARLYTDYSFITTDRAIGLAAQIFFRNMALENTSDEYKELWVAPLQIKQNIISGIDEQIRLKRAGKPAGLFFKTNSITDKKIIDKIVEASQAGVQCTMLVRGISCIVPGVKDFTDNVCVVSIVGRLLEHSRIYCFGPLDGENRVYLSSADLMTRNMDKRIEVAWPLKDPKIKDEVIGYIGTCLSDTAKLRDLLPNKAYTPLGFYAKRSDADGEVHLLDSQQYLIDQAQHRHLETAETTVFRDIEQASEQIDPEVAEAHRAEKSLRSEEPPTSMADDGAAKTDPEVAEDADEKDAEMSKTPGKLINEALSEASQSGADTPAILDPSAQVDPIEIPKKRPSLIRRLFRR